jgi:hypothetical protein
MPALRPTLISLLTLLILQGGGQFGTGVAQGRFGDPG